MIYITGDTHGRPERFSRFQKLFPKRKDYLLVCGDFGFVWDGSAKEQAVLRRLERLDCQILFVEGTHDNLDLLSQYPLEDYAGGRVRRVGKNLCWMQRGEIYTLDGKTVFALGGGESPDADERQPGVNWWPRELPDKTELLRAKDNLARAGNRVDLIVTHQNPRIELGLIDPDRPRLNSLISFLGGLAKTVDYRHWYFGGDHADRPISPRMTAVFKKILTFEP